MHAWPWGQGFDPMSSGEGLGPVDRGVIPIGMYINKSAGAKIYAYSSGHGLGPLGMGFDPICMCLLSRGLAPWT